MYGFGKQKIRGRNRTRQHFLKTGYFRRRYEMSGLKESGIINPSQ
jgi:hypothetical protein